MPPLPKPRQEKDTGTAVMKNETNKREANECETNNRELKLSVVKKEAYVWGLSNFGQHEHHRHIPCWYVINSETQEVLTGGFSRGNNTRSGKADIPRRKDAKAWMEGYQAALAGKALSDNPHKAERKQIVKYGIGLLSYERSKGCDEETESFWEDGFETVSRQPRKLYKLDCYV